MTNSYKLAERINSDVNARVTYKSDLEQFDTPEQAFNAYKPFKEALCKELALKWKDEIDPRVYDAMMKWEVSITS